MIPVKSQLLPVMESFYTIQGEGYHQGTAAWFIRLAGCDVGCVWCDVKDSWDAKNHPLKTIENITAEIKDSPARIVVITGGEPLMHNLDGLSAVLKASGFAVHIETSGTYPLSGDPDWVCLSPKKFKAPLPELVNSASELKTVIFHPSDFAWAEKYAALVPEKCRLYLQPEWDKSDKITPLIVEYVKKYPKWGLSVQIHKYIHVP